MYSMQAPSCFLVGTPWWSCSITGCSWRKTSQLPSVQRDAIRREQRLQRLVLLFAPDPGDDGSGTLLGGAVADNFGGYALKVPAGTYGVGAVRSIISATSSRRR